jgi:Xaa-Pro aminopeptidase
MTRASRKQKLLRLLKGEGLESLFITSLPNLRYLCGFTGSWACGLVSDRSCLLFTDFRYKLQARKEVKGFRVMTLAGGDLFQMVAEKAKRMGFKEVSFEEESLTYGGYRQLRKALGGSCRLVAAPPLIGRLRMIKDSDEITVLRKLARMTDGVINECKGHIRAGITEKQIARYLESMAWEAGAEGVSFHPIVASGLHSAMPHYRSGSARLRKGKPVIVDFGLTRKGYNSDLTRTFHLGTVTPKYREIYSVVLEAQQVALQKIKPGIKACQVDRCAREYISSRGFGKFFGHGLGHGIGMEVHEAPRLGRNSEIALETDMVFSVEPGIYLPGWGGVRIEDMVVVQKHGCSVLTSSMKEIEDSVL